MTTPGQSRPWSIAMKLYSTFPKASGRTLEGCFFTPLRSIYSRSPPNYIYIHTYIYIVIFWHQLFHCIATFQCEKTRDMLPAGIFTRLTLCKTDTLPQTFINLRVCEEILNIPFFTYTLSTIWSVQFC